MNFLLRTVTFRPQFIRLIRALGLRSIGRQLYYRWARPPDGIVQGKMGGTCGQFHV